MKILILSFLLVFSCFGFDGSILKTQKVFTATSSTPLALDGNAKRKNLYMYNLDSTNHTYFKFGSGTGSGSGTNGYRIPANTGVNLQNPPADAVYMYASPSVDVYIHEGDSF